MVRFSAEGAWETLSQVPVGRVIAWIFLVSAIVTGICTATVKLYKPFERYKKLKDTNDRVLKLLESHETALVEVRDALKRIDSRMGKQDGIMMSQISHSIVLSAEQAIKDGSISFNELKSISELYTIYKDEYKGNGYIKLLYEHVTKLPVTGGQTE